MCGIVKAIVGGIGSLFGGGNDSPPPVVYQSPKADQAAADAAAAGSAAQDRTRLRRAMRGSSLLATGGDGDLSGSAAGTPSAAGKTSLGA